MASSILHLPPRPVDYTVNPAEPQDANFARVIITFDDVTVSLEPSVTFEPKPDDLIIDLDSPDATADRLEPDLAAEFVRNSLALKNLIPADALAEAAANGDRRLVEAILNRTPITQAFDSLAESLMEAVGRGQASNVDDLNADPPCKTSRRLGEA